MDEKLKSIKKIHTMFHVFRRDMANIWKEYYYVTHLLQHTTKEEYHSLALHSNTSKLMNKSYVGGMQSRLLNGSNSRTHFIETICRFEDYINSLASIVFHDYPYKISGSKMDAQKLYDYILQSPDKETIIDHIIEEKIRSIFYGNPVEIFTGDKCKFELGTLFKDKYKDAIPFFAEIIGRRNLIVHNSGRVDKKHLRENSSSTLKGGQKIIVSEDYLRGTIGLLIGISAITTKTVIENIYRGEVKGVLDSCTSTFDACMRNNWYFNLLK